MEQFYTGLAAEFIVAAELARRNFNVAITIGNTKKLDMIVEINGNSKKIQVKGIKQRKNNNFRLKVNSLEPGYWYVFVNVNRIELDLGYEFAIMNYKEVIENLRRNVNEDDNAIKVGVLDNPMFRNKWERLG